MDADKTCLSSFVINPLELSSVARIVLMFLPFLSYLSSPFTQIFLSNRRVITDDYYSEVYDGNKVAMGERTFN